VKFPGMGFLREQSAVKAFESQEPAFREIVFYSEGAGDWPHLGPIIEALLSGHDRMISYLTSDPTDPGLMVDNPRLRSFNIGSGTARTILFARMDCRHFVMTLPDLGNLWLKRSVHPVHYVYTFHSMNSTHTSYRTGAFDQFDTILCVGPHHVDEIRRTEAAYGLPQKELVHHGSAKLDTLLSEITPPDAAHDHDGPARVLVAPTWGESSLIEAEIGTAVIDALLEAGHPVVLRLHPMTVRRLPRLVSDLRRRYAEAPAFALEERMSATQSWLEADVMVSDWSGAATEYAFALGKPVAYIGTPPKIMNPEWERTALRSFEDRVRVELGRVVEPSDVSTLPEIIASLVADPSATRQRAESTRDRSVFNVGSSSAAAAAYLAGLGADS
jgi:hypothetical protein